VFVLGIDPGLSRCGYAGIDDRGRPGTGAPGEFTVRALGVITTPPQDPLPARLAALAADLRALFDELHPTVVAVEQVFFQVNVRTAMAVAQASGIALATAAERGCEVVQYTPNEVKHAVTGWGGAGKPEVTRMVQVRLGLSRPPKPADAADAAAIALCHVIHAPWRARLAQVAR